MLAAIAACTLSVVELPQVHSLFPAAASPFFLPGSLLLQPPSTPSLPLPGEARSETRPPPPYEGCVSDDDDDTAAPPPVAASVLTPPAMHIDDGAMPAGSGSSSGGGGGSSSSGSADTVRARLMVQRRRVRGNCTHQAVRRVVAGDVWGLAVRGV